MSYKSSKCKVAFKYGALNASKLAEVDVNQFYVAQGGKIEQETQVQFSSYFHGAPYAKTALTSSMGPNYLCMGSINAHYIQPNGDVDVISISVFRDTTQKAKSTSGAHFNTYLQYEINGERNHTNKIPDRHIPLNDGVLLKAIICGEREVMQEIIQPI